MEEKECEILVSRSDKAEAEHYQHGYYQRKKFHHHIYLGICLDNWHASI